MNGWNLDQFGGLGNDSKAWLPYLMKAIYGKVGGEQNTIDKWFRNQTMGLTAGLGQGIGANLSRTGVPVASGAQTLANRYMAPMSDLLETNKPKTWSENMGTSAGMMELLGPLWEEYMKTLGHTPGFGGGQRGWMPDINKFMNLWGGGNKNRFGGSRFTMNGGL